MISTLQPPARPVTTLFSTLVRGALGGLVLSAEGQTLRRATQVFLFIREQRQSHSHPGTSASLSCQSSVWAKAVAGGGAGSTRIVVATCNGCSATASCNAATEVLTGGGCGLTNSTSTWLPSASNTSITATSYTCTYINPGWMVYARAICMTK